MLCGRMGRRASSQCLEVSGVCNGLPRGTAEYKLEGGRNGIFHVGVDGDMVLVELRSVTKDKRAQACSPRQQL